MLLGLFWHDTLSTKGLMCMIRLVFNAEVIFSWCFLSLNHRRVEWIRGRTQSERVLQPCQWNLDETTRHASQESIPWTDSLGRQPVCCRWGKAWDFTGVGCDPFGRCHRSRALARVWSRKSVKHILSAFCSTSQKFETITFSLVNKNLKLLQLHAVLVLSRALDPVYCPKGQQLQE